jgi:hypothetical protein
MRKHCFLAGGVFITKTHYLRFFNMLWVIV